MAQGIEYTRPAVNDVVNNFSGDANHVWVTGLSNGGGYRHGAPYAGVETAHRGLATRNGCSAGAFTPSYEYVGATTLRPDTCAAATEILRVEDAGHTWFDYPVAETVVWDFFTANG